MADLKTNYVDDVLDSSKNQLRKYQQIQNDDGTVSFVDVTEYSTTGTSFGAKDINDTNAAVNEINNSLASISFQCTLNTSFSTLSIKQECYYIPSSKTVRMLLKFSSTNPISSSAVFGYVPLEYRKPNVLGYCSVLQSSNSQYVSGECTMNDKGQITQGATQSNVRVLFCIFDYKLD